MLTNNTDLEIDLIIEKKRAIEYILKDFGENTYEYNEIFEFNYPVVSYPAKVKSLNFDKTNEYSGRLTGIKGQYLIFEDNTVLNIRRHGGYFLSIEIN